MATDGNDVSSDEVTDSRCFTCNSMSALKFCVECQGYLCKTCIDYHLLIPVTKGHTLLGKHDNASFTGQAAELPTIPTERCRIHTIKLVDMYCKDHDEVGCTTCMALNHRSCTHVHSIPDDIDVLYNAADIENINRSLQSSEQRFKSIAVKKKEALTALTLSREKANMSIDNTKREIITNVENLAKQAKEELEKKFLDTKAQIEKEKNEANERMDDLKKMSTYLTTSERNKSQQFVCLKIANRKIIEAEKNVQTLQSNEEANISFDVDPIIKRFSRETMTFGRVSCGKGPKGLKRYAVETIRDMHVKLQDDKSQCHIFSSCLIEGERLLFVDHNNKNLKRANIETMKVESVCSFDNDPYCVCCTRKDEAVVTFYMSANFIQFISIGRQITLSRKVNINHNCLGISYRDDQLYIADNSKTVYIHDIRGTEIQKISVDSSGNDLFNTVRGLSFSENMRGGVVADWNKGLIILNDQYQPIAGYCDAELKGATSVCTDGRGSIFVCGYNSQNVLQIGYDGKKIDNVAKKSTGIEKALSLFFDSTCCRLIVTLGRSDIVKIIQLR